MEYKIRSRLWIEADGEILLGEGRVWLLKEIEKTGSLTKAAKSMGMSYKKAWSLINTISSRAEFPVLITTIGGKSGGGTVLTTYGKTLIKTYETINENCWKFLDEQISKSNLK